MVIPTMYISDVAFIEEEVDNRNMMDLKIKISSSDNISNVHIKITCFNLFNKTSRNYNCDNV